jgi:hypothetical protein
VRLKEDASTLNSLGIFSTVILSERFDSEILSMVSEISFTGVSAFFAIKKPPDAEMTIMESMEMERTIL